MAESKKPGRPSKLSDAEKHEVRRYREAGVSIGVSVPTANRIIAKFRRFDEQIEPAAREFRERINSLRDST